MRIFMRSLLLILGFMVALLLLPLAATADDVIVDTQSTGSSVPIELTKSDDGLVGSIRLTNTSHTTDYTVSLAEQTSGCTFTTDPGSLVAGRAATITFRAKDCEVDDGASMSGAIALKVNGTTVQSIAVTSKVKQKAEPVPLAAVLPSFAWAAIAGVLVLAGVGWSATLRKADSRQSLPGVPKNWSFKDSWASNLSVASSVFVGLFGVKDAISALLGKASDTTAAELVIVAALAGILVGIAPFVVTIVSVGGDPTVRGVAAGAFCTVTGVAGQIFGVYWALTGDQLLSDKPLHGEVPVAGTVMAIALIVMLVLYSVLTLSQLLKKAKHEPPEPSDELLIAAMLALGPGDLPLDRLLDAREVATDYLGHPNAPLMAALTKVIDTKGTGRELRSMALDVRSSIAADSGRSIFTGSTRTAIL